MKKPALPPPLRPGDLITISAPAGAVKRGALIRGAELIAGRGYRVGYRQDLFARDGYLAGDDRRRADELNGWLGDRDVRAILLARGGYGISRIVGSLSAGLLKKKPKIVVGYSDATVLLLFLLQRTGVVVFHGPFVTDAERDLRLLLRTLSGPVGPLSFGRLRPLRPGRARAPVTGGNLSLLAHSIGTPFEVQTRGRLLYVEEVNEPPYRVDRMLRQLVLAGKFRGIRGLLIGRFSGCTRSEKQACERLLLEAVAGMEIPVAARFPAGHGPGNATFPLGVRADLDTSAGSITFDPFLSP